MSSISAMLKAKTQKEKEPPMSQEEALEFIRSRMTHKTNFENSIIVLVGAWKNGKSICALSISDQFPDTLPTEKLTVIEDTWVFSVDPGGHDGFRELGLTVPYSDLTVPPKELREYEDKFDTEIEKVRQLVALGIIKNVVFDSVSYYDDNIMSYLSRKYANSKEKPWGELRQIHTERFHKLRSLGCRMIVCVHPAENIIWGSEGSEVEQKSKKRQMISMLPGSADFKLAITGRSAGLYKGGASLILPVVKETVKKPKEPPQDNYYIHLGPAKGIEGGIRLGRFLEPKQPANLKQLFQKIRESQPEV